MKANYANAFTSLRHGKRIHDHIYEELFGTILWSGMREWGQGLFCFGLVFCLKDIQEGGGAGDTG